MEDNFSTNLVAGGYDGSGGNASDGERPMKLRSLAHRSPPAAQPVPNRLRAGMGVGDP